MHERLKQLRKTLNLTLEEFGKSLGVTHTALSLWENGKRSISDPMINLICKTYGVNEEWLREGTGEMFIVSTDEYIDDTVKKYHLSETDAEIIKNFLTLTDTERKNFIDTACKLFKKTNNKKE